ncbi:hypothetical protein Z517_09094 [Fonsecaea pedrosoi CBS 271.37]|uniref:Uncharacterized protein n=1 Tax=Fonsecaea pedrosoi CBS 271.37 TaxID=1442368 RepID=A0A0D2GD83_9EURO|nr:uncharacterized protein Z517_09094 [Fonsecaea pedrosoi CBS 271.37]KIW76650.1 hypothetical protein Z517_09094 [Fonsecaea pedrosoi CBS 271.37]
MPLPTTSGSSSSTSKSHRDSRSTTTTGHKTSTLSSSSFPPRTPITQEHQAHQAQPPKRPANWTPRHDAFIREQARNGEDAESIRILFEVEYPGVSVSKAWVVERIKVTAASASGRTR